MHLSGCTVAISALVVSWPLLVSAAPQSRAPRIDDSLNILKLSEDRNALERAAVALASSGDTRAITQLGEFLQRSEFLGRLDNLKSSDRKTQHLRKVLNALEAHPSPAVADLCIALSRDKNFTADEDRMDFILETLSAVKPMTEDAARLFQQTNADGYFAFNAPLLVKNGSPHSLDLFESMLNDRSVDVERRVDSIHRSILPYRTSLSVLNSAEKLLSANLENAVAMGIIETIFDYQSKRWFGPAINAPKPPLWENASKEALQAIIGLATKVRQRNDLPPSLRASVNDTVRLIENTLASRKP